MAKRETFWIASDIVALTLRGGVLQVALVERAAAAERGKWALPGGFLLAGESAEDAARRELVEETGLPAGDVRLEQLATYSAFDRDTAHTTRVVSVAWLVFASGLPNARAGTDATEAAWVSVEDAVRMPLAFDHARILGDGLERARAKLEYTTTATAFLPDTFTMSELRSVYSAVWGIELDPANFHRKVTRADGFLEETGEIRTGRGRPAALYRVGDATVLSPPFMR